MDTTRTTLRLGDSAESIAEAADLLRRGGLVAIPTETVYGLAANALDATAVAGIFAAKGRPGWDPLIVHVCDPEMLHTVARELSPTATALADALWPGPLTMLLPRTADVPEAVTAGRDLVGVRMPSHPVTLALIRAAAVPLAAPSANRFGHISPTTAAHVLADLDGRIDAVVDAGATEVGVESTVLDPNTEPITIYRHGGVSAQAIQAITGRQAVTHQGSTHAEPEALPSPGVGIRHYAPRAKLVLVQDGTALRAHLSRVDAGSAGVMLPTGWTVDAHAARIFPWGDFADSAELARRLYAGLRDLDEAGVHLILCPLPPSGDGSDLREALRDRLRKAAMPG